MDTMLSKALREFLTGPLGQLIVNMGGKDGAIVEEELKKFNRREPCWVTTTVAQEPKSTSSILDFVSTVVVLATTGKFVAKDNFVINTEDDAPVKISYLGDNFKDWFLSGDGKIEDSINEQTLRYAKLRKSSFDLRIITELGGEEKSETTLTEMFCLMKKQRNGESGTLLNNGYANIFYIKDSADVLRPVRVCWDDGGWRVDAFSLEDPNGWCGGKYRVFYRNSVLKPLEPLLATS